MKIFAFFLLSQAASAGVLFERIDTQSPVLITRAQLSIKVDPKLCQKLAAWVSEAPEGWAKLDPKKEFENPWKQTDSKWMDTVEGCSKFPCAVKLDRQEVEIMASRPKESRVSEWLFLVSARLKAYLTSGTRRSYEFDGGISDPWKNDAWGSSGQDQYFSTTLTFLGSSYRHVRQLLHRQWKVESAAGGGVQAKVRARDIYTAHYFESWGEHYQIKCAPDGNLGLLGETAIELDQLKATDFLSRLGRSKMRRSVFEQSEKYLEAALNTWAKRAIDSSTDPNPHPNTPKGK